MPAGSSSPSPDGLRTAHFLRCLEEADVLGQLDTASQLRPSTHAALHEPSVANLEHRATRLLGSLPTSFASSLRAALQPDSALPKWLVGMRWWRPALLGGALALGWGSHQFGPERLIDILAFPLLGVLAWNAVVFCLGLWQNLRRKVPSPEPLPEALAQLPPAQQPIATLAWGRFSAQEAQWQNGGTAAKHTRWFHLAALLLTMGVVGGMYARGLTREYHAGWESTFLEHHGVHHLLSTVLGPAEAITSWKLPSSEELATMRLPFGPAAPQAARTFAAPIIHLWAITALGFVGITRGILLLLSVKQSAHLQRLPSLRYEAILASLQAEQTRLQTQTTNANSTVVVPVFYRLENRSAEALRPLVAGLWQLPAAHLTLLPPLELTEETSYLAAHSLVGKSVVVALSFAATPELDVHGAALQVIAKQSPQRLLIALDAFAFEARHADHPERKQQRLANWQRVLQAAVPDAICILLDEATERNPHQAVLAARAA
jgi:hypothetical protein